MIGLLFLFLLLPSVFAGSLPLVITTWSSQGFQDSTATAWKHLMSGDSRMNSLVEGLSTCEREQCESTVGYGGSPDENGETTLDALLIDGPGHRMGAVAQLHRVKDAARVAWAVMNYTKHTFLVGEAATQFALQMGFREENLSTNETQQWIKNWRDGNCQPNFRANVSPDPNHNCGPYKPSSGSSSSSSSFPSKKGKQLERADKDLP